MTDYIKSSLTITEFLEKEKITIEVDEFAPVVVRAIDGSLQVSTRQFMRFERDRIICPYFGSGGEGNLLKALTATCESKPLENTWQLSRVDLGAWEILDGYGHPVFQAFGYKTDGIALHDLLYKIATEEKK
jgi:hypothetical protein